MADELKNLEILCKNPECSVYELENGKTPTHIIRDFVDEPTYAVEEIEMEQDYAIEMVDDFEIEVEDSEEPGIIEGIDFTSSKVECALLIVISYDFRMGKRRDDDYEEDAP